jgi:hypothetical protein
MTNDNPKIVYHYCDVNAFLNIIQSAKLWLSDIFKMNDSKECAWINEIITDKIRLHMPRREPEKFDMLSKWKERFAISQPIYAACFSKHPDSLS